MNGGLHITACNYQLRKNLRPNASNDLDVLVMRSDIVIAGTCGTQSAIGTLPIKGANIYDPEILQPFVESLDDVSLQNYVQSLIGFRCCR